MFLCGTSLAYGDGEFVDAKARMPVAHGAAVAGRWPEGVWSVLRQGGDAALERWDPDEARWNHVAKLGAPLMNDPSVASAVVGPWPGGGALVVEYVPTVTACEHGARDCMRISSHGPSATRALPRFVLGNGQPVLDMVANVAVFDSGDLVMIGWKNLDTFVAHWQLGRVWPNVERLGDGRCGGRKLVGSSARDLVVAGRLSGKGVAPAPCAYRLQQGAWTPLALPAWGTDVVGYARLPNGTEFVALRREASEGARNWQANLWSRSPKTAWVQVALPAPSPFARGWLGRLVGAEIWAQDSGDLWILADYADACGTRDHVLYHNAPAKRVCKMLGASTRCLDAEDYQPDAWSWTCDAASPGSAK
jgi:hypothetical protein